MLILNGCRELSRGVELHSHSSLSRGYNMNCSSSTGTLIMSTG